MTRGVLFLLIIFVIIKGSGTETLSAIILIGSLWIGIWQKFAEIFKTADIKKVTNLFMEVPCCSALPMIVKKGMDKAGVKIPTEDVVIGRQGEIRPS